MRSVISIAAILATLSLQALSQPALGAGPIPAVDTLLDVHSTSMTGTTFTAPETGTYHFTIVSGAFCYLPLGPGETSPYGGWLTQIQIYTKTVPWGAPDQWGQHPLKPDAAVGGGQHHPTSTEAATAGKGKTTALTIKKGTRLTLLVSDGSNYYGDNQGTVRVRITADFAAPVVAPPNVPTTPTTPSQPTTTTANPVAPTPKPLKPINQ